MKINVKIKVTKIIIISILKRYFYNLKPKIPHYTLFISHPKIPTMINVKLKYVYLYSK